MVGSSTFVIISTDYNSSALTCTCQDTSIIGLMFVHRRSCSILQRDPELDAEILASVRLYRGLQKEVVNLFYKGLPTSFGDTL